MAEDKGEHHTQGVSMTDWVNALSHAGESQAAGKLQEDRLVAIEKMNRLGLPQLKNMILPLGDFLDTPQQFFEHLQSPTFYINIVPQKEGLQKLRQLGLDKEGVLKFITQHVPSDLIPFYSMLLSEFYENIYSGTIVINNNGKVYIEGARGSHPAIANGKIVPEFIARMERLPGHRRLNLIAPDNTPIDDPALQKALGSTLLSIPHEGLNLLPGSYDFSLITKGDNATLEPIFHDYKDDPLYQVA